MAKYMAAHARILKARGPARRYRCVDCDARADQWSYNHADPQQVCDEQGRQYSLDPMFYDPRCRRCHQRFDRHHRADSLRTIADTVADQLRHAVIERDRARRFGDVEAETHWDDQMEVLVEPLLHQVGLPRRGSFEGMLQR